MGFNRCNKALIALGVLSLAAAAGQALAAQNYAKPQAGAGQASVQTVPPRSGPLACPEQLLQDPGFETTSSDGGPNAFWTSTTTQGDSAFWSSGEMHTGSWAAWFGGYSASSETHSISQSVTIPAGNQRWLNYWRKISRTGAGVNTVTFTVDGNVVRTENLNTIGLDATWIQQAIDISAYANGAVHAIKVTYQHSGSTTDANYFLDDVTIDCVAQPVSLQQFSVD